MRTRSYLLFMALVILIPVAAFSWVGLDMLVRWERDARLRSVQETVQAAAVRLDREVAAAQASLRVFANSQLLKSENFAQLHELMSVSNRTSDSWTLLSDANGKALVNTLVPYGTSLPKAGGKWVDRVLNSQGLSVSNYFVGTLAKQPTVSVDMPAILSPSKKYAFSQIFYATHFARVFDSQSIKPTWLIGIFDRNGIAIVRGAQHSQFVGKPVPKELYQASQKNYSGVIRFPSSDGIDVYGVFTRTELTNWTVGIGVPVSEIEAPARQAALFYALALSITFALAAFAAVLLGRKISRSLDDAASVANALGKGMPLGFRKSNVHEIDVLQSSLHKTGTQLSEAQALHRTLEEERELLLCKEQEARKLAESQNKAKDEFLAMLGHELRNPLAAISAGISLLNHEEISAELSLRARGIIERQSQHLGKMVDELLEAHRVVSGKITLAKKTVNLEEAVQACIAAFEAQGATQKYVVSITTESACIDADPTRLEQIINNLLENAFKYTPEGGKVAIKVAIENSEAVLTVQDSGIGIAPEFLPKVFDVFVQGPVTNRAKGGLGIGLAVVRALVKEHGATIAADSRGHNRGSTFIVRFPLSSSTAEISPANKGKYRAHTALSILVIEDNEDVREMLCAQLAMSGHKVSSASTGRDGINKAKTAQLDIAIVDIDLPDMLGYDIALQLRADMLTASMILIAVTGYGQESDKEKALNSGFDFHLKKPIALNELIAIMEAQVHAG